MKRIMIALFITFASLCCVGWADGMGAISKASNVNVFDYVERFTANLNEYRYTYNNDSEVEWTNNVGCLDNPEGNMFIFNGGTVAYDDGNNICSVIMEFYENADTVKTDYIKCMIMISALEYNATEQWAMSQFFNEGLSGTGNVYMESNEILGQIWSNVGNKLESKMVDGDVYFAYSGKQFNYYIEYCEMKNEDGTIKRKWVDLVAPGK